MAQNQPPARFWADMTTTDFANCGDWIAILPIAAIEQHGPHLPLATDTAIAEGMIEATISQLPADLPAVFLPIQTIGKSDEHGDFPGTLSLNWQTIIQSWVDIGRCVKQSGVNKFIIVSSHGGNNNAMQIAADTLHHQHGLNTITTSWSRFGTPDNAITAQENAIGIHAGTVETSLMLHFKPQLVRTEKAQNFSSSQSKMTDTHKYLHHHGRHQRAWKAQELNPTGAMGDATAATNKLGREIAQYRAQGFMTLLSELAEKSGF